MLPLQCGLEAILKFSGNVEVWWRFRLCHTPKYDHEIEIGTPLFCETQ